MVKPELESLIQKVFEDRMEAYRLFCTVRDYVGSLGPVDVLPRKTQVTFRRARSFAWVWLPQMWINSQPPSNITLSFSLDHEVRDRRIKQSLEPYPGRFMHHVVIRQSQDFDSVVRGWLSDAYGLAGKKLRPANARSGGRNTSQRHR